MIIVGPAASPDVLQCDPKGPYKGCGGNMLFDSNATCLKSDASFYGGFYWCTQVHCCKSVSHEVMLTKAIALNGTSCNCNIPWPCASIDLGQCLQGTNKENTDVTTQCWNEDTPSMVPCIGSHVTIPKG